MTEENKTSELKEEDLEKVNGGLDNAIDYDHDKYPYPKFTNVFYGQCPNCQHICRYGDGTIDYSKAYDKYYCYACGNWSDTIWSVAIGK